MVLEHKSSSVAYSVYKGLLDEAAKLLPLGCRIVFLADRSFVDTDLMCHLQRLGWHWRIRIRGGAYQIANAKGLDQQPGHWQAAVQPLEADSRA
jgi:hypothetical protein